MKIGKQSCPEQISHKIGHRKQRKKANPKQEATLST